MSKAQTRKRHQLKISRLEIVAQLYKRGYSVRKIQSEVMKRLDLATYSTATVQRDINTLLNEWREQRLTDVDLALQLELERIDDAIRELWEQWEKSKTNYTKTARKQKVSPGREDAQGQCQQLAERRKLLGLYAATKTEVTGKDGTPLIPAEKMTEEEIQAEIDRIRSSRNS